MATDYASLVLDVDSRDVRQATRELKGLERQGGITSRATASLTGFMGGLAGALLTVGAGAAVLSKAISVQREFDTLNAGLITATGSAENAAVAFEALTDFAATTPYDLKQVTDGYIKLVNLGLDPSERAMRSYGNTASAMAKDMNMMIEAVADAATGEFERLKEFGIKAKSQGDDVALTFQGITTKIGKNAREIEEYLIKIGETNFAGAMDLRMASLDGKLSNIADSWDAMFRNIMAGDIGETIEGMADGAINALEGINDYLSSGEFEGHIASMGAAFGPLMEDAGDAFDFIWNAIQEQNNLIEANNPELLRVLTEAWSDFPENVRAVVQLVASHVAWLVERIKIGAEAMKGYLGAVNDGVGGVQIKDVYEQAAAASARNNENLDEAIKLTYEQRAATQAAQKAAADKAAADRAEYERKKGEKGAWFSPGRPDADPSSSGKAASDAAAKKAKAQLDSLRNSLQTEEEEIASSYAEREAIISASLQRGSAEQIELSRRSLDQRDRELSKLAESRAKDLDNLQDSLMTEEEAIQQSYDRRIAIINENSTADEATKAAMRERVNADREAELAEYAAAEQRKRDVLWQGLMTEEEMQRQYYEERRQMILTATEITEMERQELLRRLQDQFNQEQIQREQAKNRAITGVAGDFFGAMASLAGSYGDKQSKEAKRAFKIQQAAATAQAVIKTYEAATSAYASLAGIPVVGPALGAAAAAAAVIAGMANVRNIQSQQYAGAYDQGGHIPANKWGWVGENGPERVRGPASITSRKSSERYANGGGGGPVTVQTNVYLDSNGNSRTDTSGSAQEGRELGNVVGAKVREILQIEQRAGGILWRMKNG